MKAMYRVQGEDVNCYHVEVDGDNIEYEVWKDGKLLTITEPLISSVYKWIDNLVDVSIEVRDNKRNGVII